MASDNMEGTGGQGLTSSAGPNLRTAVFYNEQFTSQQDRQGRLGQAELHGQGMAQQEEAFGHDDSLSAGNGGNNSNSDSNSDSNSSINDNNNNSNSNSHSSINSNNYNNSYIMSHSYNNSNNNSSSDNPGSSSSATAMPVFYRCCPTAYQPGVPVNVTPPAGVYNMGSWTRWDPQQQQQQQQLAHRPQLAQQLHHSDHSLHPHQMQPPQPPQRPSYSMSQHQLNVSAPSFTPPGARSYTGWPAMGPAVNGPRAAGQLMPNQSEPQMQGSSYSGGYWRRQHQPDLLGMVLNLMRELNRTVSYPELIGVLSLRLHRLPIELKRHVPHILHGAVVNGYLSKEGHYYTLLSEEEQREIMMRNLEEARRAKELEKQPLSWRIR